MAHQLFKLIRRDGLAKISYSLVSVRSVPLRLLLRPAADLLCLPPSQMNVPQAVLKGAFQTRSLARVPSQVTHGEPLPLFRRRYATLLCSSTSFWSRGCRLLVPFSHFSISAQSITFSVRRETVVTAEFGPSQARTRWNAASSLLNHTNLKPWISCLLLNVPQRPHLIPSPHIHRLHPPNPRPPPIPLAPKTPPMTRHQVLLTPTVPVWSSLRSVQNLHRQLHILTPLQQVATDLKLDETPPSLSPDSCVALNFSREEGTFLQYTALDNSRLSAPALGAFRHGLTEVFKGCRGEWRLVNYVGTLDLDEEGPSTPNLLPIGSALFLNMDKVEPTSLDTLKDIFFQSRPHQDGFLIHIHEYSFDFPSSSRPTPSNPAPSDSTPSSPSNLNPTSPDRTSSDPTLPIDSPTPPTWASQLEALNRARQQGAVHLTTAPPQPTTTRSTDKRSKPHLDYVLHFTNRQSSLKLGASLGGHEKGYSGSLGGVVRGKTSGDLFGLSTAHVFEEEERGVQSPSEEDLDFFLKSRPLRANETRDGIAASARAFGQVKERTYEECEWDELRMEVEDSRSRNKRPTEKDPTIHLIDYALLKLDPQSTFPTTCSYPINDDDDNDDHSATRTSSFDHAHSLVRFASPIQMRKVLLVGRTSGTRMGVIQPFLHGGVLLGGPAREKRAQELFARGAASSEEVLPTIEYCAQGVGLNVNGRSDGFGIAGDSGGAVLEFGTNRFIGIFLGGGNCYGYFIPARYVIPPLEQSIGDDLEWVPL